MAFLRRIKPILFPLVLILLASAARAADDDLARHFHFSGFATLGVTKGGNDILGFRRELDREGLFDGDWSFLSESTIGLQMDVNPTGSLGGTLQILGKDTVDDNWHDAITWAFLRYRFNSDWTLRAGRIGIDQYMLSDYRNLGFAYLWSRPPVEFYTPISFDFFDGADLTWSKPMDSGTLQAKMQVGQTRNVFFIRGTEVDLKLNPIVGLTLNWETERWQARVSASRLRFDNDDEYFPSTETLAETLRNPSLALFWPQAASYADAFKLDDPYLHYVSAGVAFDNMAWRVQLETSYVESDVEFYPSLFGGYFSVGHKIDSITPFVLMAWAESRDEHVNVTPPSPSPIPPLNALLNTLSTGLQEARDLSFIEQHTLSFGMRWDVRYDIALKAQWDHSWVGARGGALWEQLDVPAEDMELDTFSINLNVIF